MTHHLAYGSALVPVDLPTGARVTTLASRVRAPASSPRDVVRAGLASPVGSPTLRDLARGKRTAVILIPGKTRVAGTRDYLPELLAELNDGGIPDDRIEVVLATGTHEPHIDNDVEGLLGAEVAARVRCTAHECTRAEVLERVGTTRAGTPVLFHRSVLEADVKVLTGRVVPHYFAGYSGGRRALLPGVAGLASIVANHRLTLDPERGLHAHAACGSLARNPVHLDMVEAAAMAAPDFALSTLVDSEGRVARVVTGHFLQSHAAICAEAESALRTSVPRPFDALVTSAGGEPSDCNFMQSLKALFNFRGVVRPRGAILWIARCAQGMHPGFLDLGAIASDDEMEREVRARYTLTGHNSLMLRRLLREVDVAMLSALPAPALATLGIHPVRSIGEGIDWLRERMPAGFTCALAPHANVISAGVGAAS